VPTTSKEFLWNFLCIEGRGNLPDIPKSFERIRLFWCTSVLKVRLYLSILFQLFSPLQGLEMNKTAYVGTLFWLCVNGGLVLGVLLCWQFRPRVSCNSLRCCYPWLLPSFLVTYHRSQIFNLNPESTASSCMDIHRTQWISKWISIKAWINKDWYPLKHGYPFMDIHVPGTFIVECPWYPCLDINVDVHTWMAELKIDIKKGYPYGINVEFWKSM